MRDSPRKPVDPPAEAHETLALPPAPERLALTGDAPPPQEPEHHHRWWLWVLLILLLVIAAYFLWPTISGKKDQAPTKAGKGKGDAGVAIPVVATAVRKGDIGVYVTGIGAVTPLATVTVKTRVDGQLTKVNYREGDTVKKGDLLVEIDDGPYRAALTQAEGQLTRDQALLDNARIDLARYQQLVPQKAVPEQMLATQQATVHQDEGTVKVDQGLIDAAKVNLAYTKIYAPISGKIGLRLVDEGNIVNATDSTGLVVITQMDPISVVFTISEDQLPAVLQKVGAGQTLEVDAYSREGFTTKIGQGSLTTLDNQIDPTTGTLKLRATFDNAKGTLYPNQFVNYKLLVQEKRGVTLVSTAAVQRNTNATYVYVIKQDSTVTVRPITIGTTEGDDSEVTMGLNPGDQVVMTGVDKLQEGTKVNAQGNAQSNAQGNAQGNAKGNAQGKAPASGASKKGK